MATPEAQEAAAKQRIIKHMNADHADSIRRYMGAYTSASMFQSRKAQMTDIDLSSMKFSNGSTVAFDPPLKSLRETRERLVQMDKEALKTLGQSDIAIKTYIPPYAKLTHLWNFSQCLLVYFLLPNAANFQPGSLLYDNLLFMVPAFASFVLRIRWMVLGVMIPIHLIESGLMAMKVSKHGLTPLDGLWWAWVASCFVEGFTSFWRLDEWVEGKKREKEAKKH
ncbi:integral membrane protein-like protein [Dothidotthia symphoricarpi CBS 119687]|uniref:Integral membrane protein-like protein n=1 Tax=Dothidotthia symphoricarpi CBS 119687 TaxID=1392245 RepID=A0A6A6AIM1_9PLEO|nr:integral membrane protein-like protein [Dothidotthia symphoricarpi CBS 119687]KAF2130757.1 integral membrane protein-like protein [Dothidotthia symphoricarpi CBS 119687]